MKSKQIIFVVVAFAVLGLLYWYQQSSREETITRGLGYEEIIALAQDEIGEVKCYLGGRQEQAVHLVRADDGWKVKSRFDARAKEDKMDQLLEKLSGLEGTVRSRSEAVLSDYGLEKENALHLEIYNKDGRLEKHLLIGNQAENYQENFIRTADSPAVYPVGVNLRGDFGLYAETNDKSPESKPWIDLSLFEAEQDAISAVALNTPYRDVVLNLLEKTPEAIEDATAAAETGPETEWTFIEPRIEAAPLESGVNRLLGAFSNMTVSDVVARGGLEKYGFEPPTATCTVTRKEGHIHRVFFGNEVPGTEGAYYVRRDDDDLIYKMDAWKVRSIFIALGELTSLAPPSAPADEVRKVEISSGDKTFAFTRASSDEDWVVTVPEIDLQLESDRVDTMVSALADPRIKDKATTPRPEVTGLEKPEATARLTLENGEEITILLGNTVPLTDNSRFYRIEGEESVWVVQKNIYRDAVPKTSELFDLTLTEIETDTVTGVRIKDASGQLTLQKPADLPEESTAELQWQLRLDGEEAEPVAHNRVTSLLSSLSHLMADDLVTSDVDTDLQNPGWEAQITTEDGKTLQLSLGGKAESGGSYAKVSGKDAVFILPARNADLLKRLGKTYRE
jgi:hypothetical protein